MKVLLANKFFYPKGGAETVFFQEREMLRATGHQVVDFSMRHPENAPSAHADFFVRQVDYHQAAEGDLLKRFIHYGTVSKKFVHNNEAAKNIACLVDREKPDIAHLHNIYHQLSPSIIPPLKRAGVKVVLTLHDYKLVCPNYLMLAHGGICSKCAGKKFWQATRNKCGGGSLGKSLLLSFEAYWHKMAGSFRGVDLFLAPSLFMADLMKRFHINNQKIAVLHNGIDTEEFQASPVDEGYVLYFGRISREKGIETLLRAYEKLLNLLPMKVVGTGPLLSALRGRNPGVDFLGFQGGKTLYDIVRKASYVVVPSEWYENCSMVVLEAMALGKPVIGSRIGGIPEQIEDGKTGFLYEPGNSVELRRRMETLTLDLGLRRRMGLEARQKLEREYSLAVHKSKLLDIYEGLLENRPGRRGPARS